MKIIARNMQMQQTNTERELLINFQEKIKYLLQRAFHPFSSSYITKGSISKHLKKCERLLTDETS